ncbi:MAG: bifunctional 3,4-dihydroxy-2-butanone-4-phosphate synthase/GTP cyclohydrolase II [Armatimonadetes bacterium]|nr:bifunctional 3,4-dihydroxy-2-butanone-4-phosphate synthase/GTP cyclohydrolase II [Armatimonadota bacterium]NIO74876.1 bifunctional 3,4-dihydroxy-2-butanone-4-phosphate synthase/GTP cyclohydrolase II [Armatimonadota bacterium]NIO95637.1 bifunctional 3,4-dihydroxy-2-butanone-4-phosphate synthase/GTP cyclohydrolase II [Armatimonadota bacterium]
MSIASIEEGIEEFRSGQFVIIVDDEDRENEGDLVIAAQFATPEAINFMATHGRGMICVPMLAERLETLNLPLMVAESTAALGTAFTVSVDARCGTTTGISAHDRAATVAALIDPNTKPSDLLRPGHIHPLRAKEGGVLARAGQTEASVDLAKAAGLYPAAVICEILRPDGTMARMPDLEVFAEQHNLKVITVRDLIAYRRRAEKLVRRAATVTLPTRLGSFILHAYESLVDEKPYLALICGEIDEGPTLVRIHSSCLTGDVFASRKCDCGEQLHLALRLIQQEGKGVLLYIQQEGRGIGLVNKIRAYSLQAHGHDTVEANSLLGFPADLRDYGIGAQILVDLGLRKIRMMTNNPRKIVALEGYGLEVVERVPLQISPEPDNADYLRTKKEKMGHLLDDLLDNPSRE